MPEDTLVYLEKSLVGVPQTPPGKKGPRFLPGQVLNAVRPMEVCTLVTHPDLVLQRLEICHTERGLLVYECAACWVWIITPETLSR